MSALVMLAGTVVGTANDRTSTGGKLYTICTVRVSGQTTNWWKCVCWNPDLHSEMRRLRDGDLVTMQGELQLLHNEDKRDQLLLNVTRIGSMLGDEPVKRKYRKRAAAPAKQPTHNGAWRDQQASKDPGNLDLDDDIPF